jgi:hypothetical protein
MTTAVAAACSSAKCSRCDPATRDRCVCRCGGLNHGADYGQPPRCGRCGLNIEGPNAIPRRDGDRRAPHCRNCHRAAGLRTYYKRKAASR